MEVVELCRFVHKSNQHTKTFSCIKVRVFVVKTYHYRCILSDTLPQGLVRQPHGVTRGFKPGGDTGGAGWAPNT